MRLNIGSKPTQPGKYWYFDGQTRPRIEEVILADKQIEEWFPGSNGKLVYFVLEGDFYSQPQLDFIENLPGQWSEIIEPPESFRWVAKFPALEVIDAFPEPILSDDKPVMFDGDPEVL